MCHADPSEKIFEPGALRTPRTFPMTGKDPSDLLASGEKVSSCHLANIHEGDFPVTGFFRFKVRVTERKPGVPRPPHCRYRKGTLRIPLTGISSPKGLLLHREGDQAQQRHDAQGEGEYGEHDEHYCPIMPPKAPVPSALPVSQSQDSFPRIGIHRIHPMGFSKKFSALKTIDFVHGGVHRIHYSDSTKHSRRWYAA